jgi:hypothetical protein
VTGRAQYGQLIRDAGRHILAASVELEGQQFANRAVAGRAVKAYLDLLHALGRHGRQLVGPDVHLHRADAADPRDALGARLVDHLAHVGLRDLGSTKSRAGVAGSWAAAASSVRAATDLLATHRDAQGAWRSPESAVLDDPSTRGAGFGELAAIAIPVASAGSPLSLRVGQAGYDWQAVEGLVPEVGPLLEVALEARALNGLAGFAPLATMGVARPAVRSGDPVVELGDRLARLHRVAWQLTREERVGACTLAGFAVAGVLVHDHAGQLLRLRAGSEGPVDLGERRGLARLEEGAASWRLVHLNVRQLRTTTPELAGLRADVVAVRELLERLVAAPPSPQLQAVVVGGARSFGDIAGWNLQALDRLARSGQLLVLGRHLTGDEVSDHPVLVEAKLKGRLAPASKDRLQPLRVAYASAVSAGQAAFPSVNASPTPEVDRGPVSHI